MKKPFKVGRRNFLRGAAGAVLAVPFLPSVMGTSSAQMMGQKNFISWRVTNGQFGHQWYPSDAQTTGLSVVEPNVREMMLEDIPGNISTILDDRFDAFRSKAILFKHIDRLDLADHNRANGLFGWSTKDAGDNDFLGLPSSIDQIMAERIFGGIPPLNLCVRWSSDGVSCSFSTTGSGSLVMEPGLYPEQAYQRLFSDFEVDETVAERRRDYKRSIVDRVLPHYQSVRDNSRMSSDDRVILDQHIEHMHTLSQQLGQDFGECAPPDSPTRFNRSPEAVNAAAQAQVDIAIAALRCGMSRVVNFYLDPDVLMTPELHGVDGGHHGASHNSDAGSIVSIENAHKWHMNYFIDFLQKLDASTDAMGNNLLDQSLVFLNNEVGNQAGSSGNQPGDVDLNHIGLDVQTMIVGSAGGALRTGTFLDYRTDHERNRWTRYIGTAYNRVLISCMLAMGLTPDDWEVGGQPGYGDMRGAQYNQTPLDKVVIGDLRASLPRLTAMGFAVCANGGEWCDEPAVAIVPALLGTGAALGTGAGLGSLGDGTAASQRVGWGLSGAWPGALFGASLSMATSLSIDAELDGVSAFIIGTSSAVGAGLGYVLYHALGADEHRAMTSLTIGWIAAGVGLIAAFAPAVLNGMDSRDAGRTLGFASSAGLALGTAIPAIAW